MAGVPRHQKRRQEYSDLGVRLGRRSAEMSLGAADTSVRATSGYEVGPKERSTQSSDVPWCRGRRPEYTGMDVLVRATGDEREGH